MPASRGPRSRCRTRKIMANRMRESVVWSAQNFTAKYPGDRRGPRLLVEAATVCDDVPNQKRDLLEEALRLTDEEPLKRRIADDLRRVDLLGKPLDLRMSSVSDGQIDLAKLRGNVVVLIFWSADSPHSLLWLRDFRSSWETLPKDRTAHCYGEPRREAAELREPFSGTPRRLADTF